MKPKIFISAILTLVVTEIYAQGSADALRFSQIFNGGTARFTSMGGAFGALGGDFGAISYNPAGLGVYRTSEFTITPSFKSRSINSTYNGNSMKDTRTRFYFDNVGFVMSFKPNKSSETGLVNFNIGLGYNRSNDFYSNSIANGENEQNSILDYYAGLASSNGLDYNNLTQWAWDGYLIDPAPGGGYWAMLGEGDGVLQQNTLETEGTFGEYVFSFASNISNKLFLGATFGIQNFFYSHSETYLEDAFDSNPVLTNGYRFYYMDYSQTFETEGSGYNFKIGAIYKPIEGLRIGFALHTPTYFNFNDTFSSSMYTDLDSTGLQRTYEFESGNSKYDYKFETPFKMIGSIAYVFKEVGLISFDYEYLDYSSMRFRDGGDGYTYSNENIELGQVFKSSSNIRIGGEFKLGDVYLRGGYAFYGNPYSSGYLNDKSKRSIISGGIGYRSGNFFIDAAYMRSILTQKYIFYDLRDIDNNLIVNPVSTKMTEGKMLVTFGFKF